MHIQKSLWLLTFLLVGTFSLQAERIFIQFDETCMDRLQYERTGKIDPFVIYQVDVAQGEKIILEVGIEAGEFRGELPTPILNCYTGIFDQRMVENINKGVDEVFVVKPLSNGKHTITKVALAAYYRFDDTAISFSSPIYKFNFDLEFGVIGANIAHVDNAGEVTFEGRMERGCLGSYIFRLYAPQTRKPLLDMVLIPEIGIVAEDVGLSPEGTVARAKNLALINKNTLENHIQEECNRRQRVADITNAGLTPYSAQAVPAPVFQESPDMVVKGNQPLPVQAVTTNNSAGAVKTHHIVKGDNLFRLATKYKVSITELKEWNGLNSNTIYAGKELIVSEPGYSPSAVNLQPANAAAGVKAAAAPVPYYTAAGDVSVKGGTTVPSTLHTVRTGDTVASIAMKYGLTEARLREINGLKPNEYPRIGQALVTTDPDNPAARTVNTTVNPGTGNVNLSGAIPTPAGINRTPINVPSSPVNNYSYPSSSLYNNGQEVNTYSQPFSSQLDTPVPSGYSTPATNNYPANGNNAGSTITPYQPTSYSLPVTNNSGTLSGLNSTSGTAAAPTQGSKRSHLVQDGENLHDIARRYGTTVQQLSQLNRMEENEIVIPGQKIYLE